MSYTAFEIEIYGSEKLPQNRVLAAVKALPKPQSVSLHLDKNNLNVAKGKLNKYIDFEPHTAMDFVSSFADREISAALEYTSISFFPNALRSGYVRIFLSPQLSDSLHEFYEQTKLATELKKRRIQSWRLAASIAHVGGNEGELDRRVFDYAKRIAEKLIPQTAENKYILVLTDFNENVSLATKSEFLGQLEKLIEENCSQ